MQLKYYYSLLLPLGDVHSFSPVDAHNAAVSSGAMVQILALVSALEVLYML